MHAVTQVRTPDELQSIYKELLKLKTMVAGSVPKNSIEKQPSATKRSTTPPPTNNQQVSQKSADRATISGLAASA